jgi:hypothetical protein
MARIGLASCIFLWYNWQSGEGAAFFGQDNAA